MLRLDKVCQRRPNLLWITRSLLCCVTPKNSNGHLHQLAFLEGVEPIIVVILRNCFFFSLPTQFMAGMRSCVPSEESNSSARTNPDQQRSFWLAPYLTTYSCTYTYSNLKLRTKPYQLKRGTANLVSLQLRPLTLCQASCQQPLQIRSIPSFNTSSAPLTVATFRDSFYIPNKTTPLLPLLVQTTLYRCRVLGIYVSRNYSLILT